MFVQKIRLSLSPSLSLIARSSSLSPLQLISPKKKRFIIFFPCGLHGWGNSGASLRGCDGLIQGQALLKWIKAIFDTDESFGQRDFFELPKQGNFHVWDLQLVTILYEERVKSPIIRNFLKLFSRFFVPLFARSSLAGTISSHFSIFSLFFGSFLTFVSQKFSSSFDLIACGRVRVAC